MAVPRASLGGPFGGGTQPGQTAPVDIAGAIQALTSGAGGILHQRYLIRQAERNQRLGEQQHAQMEQDRQAQLAIARQREDRETETARAAAEHQRATLERQDRDFQFKQTEANKPKRHYDATRGGFVGDDGSFTAVSGLPAKPATPHAPHYDSARGVLVDDTGHVTKPAGLPDRPVTPAERMAAQSAELRARADTRAAEAATLHERNAAVAAAKGDLDEALRALPRPGTRPDAKGVHAGVMGGDPTTGKMTTVLNPEAAPGTVVRRGDSGALLRTVPSRGYQQAVADSTRMDREHVQPARSRYSRAVDAVAGPADAPPVAPPVAAAPPAAPQATGNIDLRAPSPRLRAPGTPPAAPSAAPRRVITADQREFLKARGAWNPALYEVR